MSAAPPDPSLPARPREFLPKLPLAGDPPNGLLSLPDDRLLYLVAILRDTPQPPPAMTPEEWQGFLDVLKPHGVYPLMAYRLRAWPACLLPRQAVARRALPLTRTFRAPRCRSCPRFRPAPP